MTTAAIRERLCNFINAADDKKIEAIYTILENDIAEKVEWWNDEVFFEALEKEYADWKNGNVKAFTLAEVEMSIDQLRNKREHIRLSK